MFILLILLTLADIGLGVLLIAVSGFILQGVNNTGPAPGSVAFVLMVALCFLAPLGGWWLRARAGGWAVILAALPLLIGAGLLAGSP
jgi:predicted membrane-bound mannosyltransferase